MSQEVPYRNLVLTGYMGTGKSSVGRVIATRLDAPVIDIESEIEKQEGQSLESIRQTFGQARARSLAQEACRALDLRRGAVIISSGAIFLNPLNRRHLEANGQVLCLICALDEILRRMHAAMGARFHRPAERARILAQIKREMPIAGLEHIPQLNTTHLSVDQVADRAIAYWRRGPQGLKPPSGVQ